MSGSDGIRCASADRVDPDAQGPGSLPSSLTECRSALTKISPPSRSMRAFTLLAG